MECSSVFPFFGDLCFFAFGSGLEAETPAAKKVWGSAAEIFFGVQSAAEGCRVKVRGSELRGKRNFMTCASWR